MKYHKVKVYKIDSVDLILNQTKINFTPLKVTQHLFILFSLVM